MVTLETDSQKYYSDKKVAENYDIERFLTPGGIMFDEFEKSVVISNLPMNNTNAKILDAGAGSGRFTIEIAKRGFHVIACDYSPAMLDVIRSKIENFGLTDNVELSRQDITQMTFKSNEFDYVYSLRVLVNLDTKDNERKALNEIIRVCKPGGKILIEFVNPLSIASLGPKKESMMSMKEVKNMIFTYPNVTLKKALGRRILSQTAFERCPGFLLGVLDKLDSGLSGLFPFLGVRTYYVIEKIK